MTKNQARKFNTAKFDITKLNAPGHIKDLVSRAERKIAEGHFKNARTCINEALSGIADYMQYPHSSDLDLLKKHVESLSAKCDAQDLN